MYHFYVSSIKKSFVIAVFATLCIFSAEAGSGMPGAIEGIASWYSEFSPGIRPTTANMEIFNHDEMTCAIWDFPFDSWLEVTNLRNGKKVLVRVNDRGPAKRLCREGRVIDLTMAAFDKIADLDEGLIDVKVRVVR